MSGKDERLVYKRPLCPKCGSDADILVLYSYNTMAGWILRWQDTVTFGVSILVTSNYNPILDPVEVKCDTCNYSFTGIVDEVITFFRKETQAGRYVTWSEWKEVMTS